MKIRFMSLVFDFRLTWNPGLTIRLQIVLKR